MEKKMKIAALACSYNRINKTAAFLQSLISQPVPEKFELDIYLLDDNSPDGTGDYVRKNFPSVEVVEGTGSLFWAGGMRTLWNYVVKKKSYDFFLLLNDDVVLFGDALTRLLGARNLSGQPANILLGGVQDPKNQRMTYGGFKMKNRFTGSTESVEPDGKDLKACDIGNANILLVDKATVDKIGIFSDAYTHAFADFDYTLTAIKNGVKVWLAPGYYGYCENDHGVAWLPQTTPLKKRIEYLYSPKGISLKEYLLYIKKHFPLSLPDKYIKAWLKTFFPVIYDMFKKQTV
jgi:GT2 family glycosyltransferase